MTRSARALVAALAVAASAAACTTAPSPAASTAPSGTVAPSGAPNAAGGGIAPSTLFTPLVAGTYTTPAPVRGTDGKTHLAYELTLTNALPLPFRTLASGTRGADLRSRCGCPKPAPRPAPG